MGTRPQEDADPFHTEVLRTSVLRAWRDSPTRFTEDANAEDDLRLGGYVDRLFVELAQNAADAAARAGTRGSLRVSIADGELRVANTGAPLEERGVTALASLRASSKPTQDTVGRFGLGFAAALTVTDEPRVVSRSGGVAFSADRTRRATAELPELDQQRVARGGQVPVLRLPWPCPEGESGPPAGFDTEVRLPLRADVDAEGLLAELARGAQDLLLALPWLGRLELPAETFTRTDAGGGGEDIVECAGAAGTRRWLRLPFEGEFSTEALAELGVEAASRTRWSGVWAVPVDDEGAPLPMETDVLGAPTPTDEQTSLPARLIATVPVEPTRRRVRAGAAVDAVLAGAADAYPLLLREFSASQRLALVPTGGFPLSEVDSALRELITQRLAETAWVPAADSGELPARRARVLKVPLPALVEFVADVVADLASPALCGPASMRVLAGVGVQPIGIAELVETLTGLARPPSWWYQLYDLLLAGVDSRDIAVDELGGLGVPLLDGRTIPGPRGALLLREPADEVTALLAEADIIGLRLVHPEAAHPLLERLGASRADADELLGAPALREAVRRSVSDAESAVDTAPLAETVLRLVARVGGADWLGALALPAEDGHWRRADELVLPGSPLLRVFDEDAVGADAPLAVLEPEFARRWPAEVLAEVGVLDNFAVVVDEDAEHDDHGLPDEREWLDSLAEPPAGVFAVRDLDLVADDAWPLALQLLVEQPRTWRALTHLGGHTAWWISRYALLAGAAPTEWRLPSATTLAGLYDPLPDLEIRPDVLTMIGVRGGLTVTDDEDVENLLARLGDSTRAVGAGTAMRAHTVLADAELASARIRPPRRVRTCAGTSVLAERAVVLDAPWLLALWPAERVLAIATGGERAERLAELLDVYLASERTEADVASVGEYVEWTELTAIGAVAELLGVVVPAGGVLVHEQLTIACDGARYAALWWVDDNLHAEDSAAGLARAFAWVARRWDEHHLIAALVDEPTLGTLLG